MSENDPVFHRAPMVPVEWVVACPVCGAAVAVDHLEEDDAGVWHAAREHCIIECGCGAHVEPYGAEVSESRNLPWWQGRGA